MIKPKIFSSNIIFSGISKGFKIGGNHIANINANQSFYFSVNPEGDPFYCDNRTGEERLDEALSDISKYKGIDID